MEDLEQIKDKLFKHSKSADLHISRLPTSLKAFIVEFANEHCCGDYGWAISMLLGPVSEKLDNLGAMVFEHEERLNNIENKKTEPKKLHGRERFKEKKNE